MTLVWRLLSGFPNERLYHRATLSGCEWLRHACICADVSLLREKGWLQGLQQFGNNVTSLLLSPRRVHSDGRGSFEAVLAYMGVYDIWVMTRVIT